MTSVSMSTPSTTSIDFLAPNKYRVGNPLDKDGDGVTDGKSLGGGDGKVVNEGDVNKLLAAHGLKAVNGQFQSVDGFSLSSSNTGTVTLAGGTPTLPDVAGPTASPDSLGGLMDWYGVTKGLDDAALMWMALSELAKTSMQDLKDAKQIKHAMQKGKIEAKKNAIEAEARRIDAERDAANQAFLFSVIGAVAAGLLGSFGGAAGSAMASAVGDSVSKLGDALSWNGGPKERAAQEQLREKNHEMTQEIMQQAVDSSDANYQEAKELMKLAFKIMAEHVELQSQAVQTFTRG